MNVEIADFSTLNPTLLEAWLQLFESAPDARFYHHPHWLRSIADHLTPGDLNIAFVSTEDQLRMVVPLCDSKGIRRRLHPTHDHLSLNDILINPATSENPQDLFTCINAALCEIGDTWVDWQISNVPGNSALINALTRTDQTLKETELSATANEQSIDCTDATGNWQAKTTRQSASFDCTSEACPPHGKLKRNLRRLRKQMVDTGELRVEQVTEPAQLANAFEHFLKIEASGWKGQGEDATAISANPALVSFYSAMLSPVDRGITPEINLLWSGKQCVAAQYGLRTDKCLSLLKIGYNEDFARFSPGYLLLESILADAQTRGIETLSLVTSPPWADRWHPDTVPVWHIYRYNNSTLGTALQQFGRLKQVAKSRLRKAA